MNSNKFKKVNIFWQKRLLLVILLTFLNTNNVYSQESSDFSTPDWDYYLNNHEKNQTARPVSQEEFDNAVKTLQSYQKKPKEKMEKRHWWSRKPKEEDKNTEVKEAKSKVKEVPASPDPLLRLPISIIYNNTVIKDGFYLVDTIKKDNKYFLRLKQSGNPLIDIEAKLTENSSIAPNSAIAEVIDNQTLRILYNKEITLEASVGIQK